MDNRELKANELRIGNWVMGNKPYQIDITNLVSFQYYEMIGTEYSQPIPLTEDWLLKLGAVKISNTSERKNECDWVFVGKLDLCYDVDNDSYYPLINEETEIKYVHQLQNLIFALTGTELTLTQSDNGNK